MQTVLTLKRKPVRQKNKNSLWVRIRQHKLYYMLIAPGILFYIIWHYIPMFGIIIAFKDISPYESVMGIINSPWVGLKHFEKFFDSYYFWDVLWNTLRISFLKLIWGFPAPIMLAILLNELKNERFKRVIQTISYLPHFISMVVLTGLISSVLSTNGGLVNEIVKFFGREPIFFLGDVKYFVGVLVASHVWQNVGWGTIIYLAAITGIDAELYEAAKIDGANRFQQMQSITIPSIIGVAVVLLILNVGHILSAGFEQILLLYSPSVYKVADIIDTYIYREGLISMQYSFASAVGLFKSIVGALLVLGVNYLSKKIGEEGIW